MFIDDEELSAIAQESVLTRDIDITILSVRPSVRPSVCLTRSDVVSTRLNISSYFLHVILLLPVLIFAKFRRSDLLRGI